MLDGKPVAHISAFLFHAGGNSDPSRLRENESKSFQGCIVLGAGFIFDDSDPEATPIADMDRMIAANPRNRERILPYIGGEEVNESPTQSHRRYIINFEEFSQAEARRWPDLFALVESRVKPERSKQKDSGAREKWWQFLRPRAELRSAIAREAKVRVLVDSQISQFLEFAFQPTGRVFSHALNVFILDQYSAFAVLQSRAHEIWARFFGSSLEDRLRYTPSDCFETFPFPIDWQTNKFFENVGQQYYEFRADLMNRNNEGLTATYNRFHNREERNPDILKLRQLHDAMDRAILDAYGWTDLKPTCEFILDYEEEEDDDGKPRRKKKPWRYRWPDEFRDEVLARLLALNQERAAQEKAMGSASGGTKKKPPGSKKASQNRTLL